MATLLEDLMKRKTGGLTAPQPLVGAATTDLNPMLAPQVQQNYVAPPAQSLGTQFDVNAQPNPFATAPQPQAQPAEPQAQLSPSGTRPKPSPRNTPRFGVFADPVVWKVRRSRT